MLGQLHPATQRVGDEVAGINGLAVSMPVAGLCRTIVVGPSVFARMTPEILLIGLGLAILLPVVPFALELLALRRLTTAAFGTLMALEPAFAMIVGLDRAPQIPAPPAWWASAWWSPPASARPAAAPAPRRCPPKSADVSYAGANDAESRIAVRPCGQRVWSSA